MADTEKVVTAKELWDSASKAGLVLGAVSISYMMLSQLLGGVSGSALAKFSMSIVSFLLWACKFALCIYLFFLFMKKFAGRRTEATRRDLMRYGLIVAACSALIYSAYYLVWALYIDPEALSEAIDSTMSSYSSLMDSNSRAAMEELEGRLPAISFFSNLIYCFLFGTVLSALFSSRLRSNDPFSNQQ